MFQNIELNAAHHLRFLVETLWSPKTMSLIKFPKLWVSVTAIIFCLCILWKACITWHFWATNRKLTFSWKITPLGAIPPLKFELIIAARRMLSRAVASVFLEEHRPQKLPIHGLYARVARDSCLPCKRFCRAASRTAACRAPVALLVAPRDNVPLRTGVTEAWH